MSEGLDLSRVVSMIMQNPDLIAKISELASSDKNEQTQDVSATNEEAVPETNDEQSVTTSVLVNEATKKEKRAGLISAMRPYLSDDRVRKLDTMMTVLEMVDAVRRK